MKKQFAVLIITYIKPNLVIHSDVILSGRIKVMDKNKHVLKVLDVSRQSFVTIKASPGWPGDIEVEVDDGKKRVLKELNF